MIKLTNAQRAEIQELADAYDRGRSLLIELLGQIQADWQAEIDEKSDKWRESDNGVKAQDRLDILTGWLEELPDDCNINTENME